MSPTLVLTMALAGGHGCPSSGWHSPGYAMHYAPGYHTSYSAPGRHMSYSAPGHSAYYAPSYHSSYYAPTHSTHHAPGYSTHYRYQPRSCAGGARVGQTFGGAAGGYGGQSAPAAPYSEGGYGEDRPAPPPPDVREGRDGREARSPSRAGRGQRGAPAAVIEMTNEARFQPERVTITAGQTVEWRNTSDHPHTVTADPEMGGGDNVRLPEGAEPFDSGEIRPGERFTHTFDAPGRYRYICLPHQDRGMIGEIEVLEENPQGGRGGQDAGRAAGRRSESGRGSELPEPPQQGGGARY